MGNGIESSTELDGATPLELALDRATEQYMAAQQEKRGRRRSAARASTTAIVVDGQHDMLPARLSWRGIEVTEEFQQYAMRVARGEQLAPYRGQVLARHCAEFPLGSAQRQEDTSTEALPQLRSRGPRAAAWLFGFGALVMAGLGIGSGTASSADDLGPFVPPTTTALALKPARDLEGPSLAEPETRIATAIESALEKVVPAPVSHVTAAQRALGESGAPSVRGVGLGTPSGVGAAAGAQLANRSTPLATSSSLGSAASTVVLSGLGVAGSSGALHAAPPPGIGVSTSAPRSSATSADATAGSQGPSALFSERPPF